VNKGLLAFGCGLAIAVNMAQLFTQLGDRRDPSQRPLIFTRLKYLKQAFLSPPISRTSNLATIIFH